jgi:hypothetical protein
MNNNIQYMQMNGVDNSFIPFHIDLRNEIHSYFSYFYVVKFLSSLVIKGFFFQNFQIGSILKIPKISTNKW